MMADKNYEEMLRARITELRLQKDVSEHRMSLDLDKGGAYIRGITNGSSLPSVSGLFHIIEYFDMTPAEFFLPFTEENDPNNALMEQIRKLDDSAREKVQIFVQWMTEQQ